MGARAPIDWLRGTKDADDFHDGSWDWYLLPQVSVTWFEAAGLYDGLGPLEGNGVLVACRGEAVYGVADLHGIRCAQVPQHSLREDAEPDLDQILARQGSPPARSARRRRCMKPGLKA